MSNKKCPYELLGVDRNADDKTIKKAYRKLMMKYHEDRVTNQVKSKGLDGTPEGDKMIEDAKAMASALNVAENILTDKTEHETNTGKKYTKREVYDKYGHRGLEFLQNGDDPAQTGGNVREGKHSWEQAVDIFGGMKDSIADIEIDDILDGALKTEREERKVEDILKNAKHADDSRYDADIDELLEEAREHMKGRKKASKPKDSEKSSSRKSIDDITDKLGGIFGRAKKKAEEMLSNSDNGNAIDNSESLNKAASDIIEVVGTLAASGGTLSKEELTEVITKLTDIASDIRSPSSPKKNRGFDL